MNGRSRDKVPSISALSECAARSFGGSGRVAAESPSPNEGVAAGREVGVAPAEGEPRLAHREVAGHCANRVTHGIIG